MSKIYPLFTPKPTRLESDHSAVERTIRRFAETEEIYLQNTGQGLGFGIVGGAATGIVVKTILPDGVAGQHGRLQTGDYILKINDEDLYGKGSEYASDLLRNAGQDVHLLVARGEIIEQIPDSKYREAMQQQAKALEHVKDKKIEKLRVENENLDNSGKSEEQLARDAQNVGKSQTTLNSKTKSQMSDLDIDPAVYEVCLEKSKTYGLGVHISGYVSPIGDSSGIFVKDITPNSPAETDGRIVIGDQILAVDGQRLDRNNITSEEALDILRLTGEVVTLTLRKRGGEESEYLSASPVSSKNRNDRGRKRSQKSLKSVESFSKSKLRKLQETWEQILGDMYDIIVSKK